MLRYLTGLRKKHPSLWNLQLPTTLTDLPRVALSNVEACQPPPLSCCPGAVAPHGGSIALMILSALKFAELGHEAKLVPLDCLVQSSARQMRDLQAFD